MREFDLNKAELPEDPWHLAEPVYQLTMGVIEVLVMAVNGDDRPVSVPDVTLIDRWIAGVPTHWNCYS